MKFSFSVALLTTLLGCNVEAFAPSNGRRTTTTSSLFSTTVTNSNVVLRPSTDTPDAFDSLKVGTARVHRYQRDGIESSSDSAEYVMWYHGRSKELDADKALPPLSTGRIGRAFSNNGLSWKKDPVGSESEDAKDVSLGLNNESWWGFDTAHVGLGSVLLPMSTPAVITEGGVYLMYYMGGSFEETPIADYTNKQVPTDATIKGMKMKIGVCVSQDGKTWGRVEGDDPTGAVITPYDLSDSNSQIMVASPPRGSLKEELYCAWPDVVVNVDDNKSDSQFFMYYSTMLKDSKEKCIGYATSPDGFRWLKQGICLEPDSDSETSMDNDGCARCNVVRNASYDANTATWKQESGYTMYYEGVSKDDGKHRVMMAESVDGHKWIKKGVVLDIGESEDSWDCDGVGSPHVLRYVVIFMMSDSSLLLSMSVEFPEIPLDKISFRISNNCGFDSFCLPLSLGIHTAWMMDHNVCITLAKGCKVALQMVLPG